MPRSLVCMLALVLVADGIMIFLIPVIVYAKTADITYSGLAFALWWLPRLVLTPLIGSFIDRVGVRPVSIISDITKIVGCISVVLVFALTDSPLLIAIASGLLGGVISIGNSQTLISYEKLMSVYSKNLDKDANILSRMDFLGMVLGPAVGMAMYGLGSGYLIFFVSMLYAANCLYFVRQKRWSALAPEDDAGPDRFDCSALLVVLRFPILLLLIAMAMGNNIFDGVVEAAGVSIMQELMNMSVQNFALIDICAGLSGFVATYFYARMIKALRRSTLFVCGLVAVVAASWLLTLSLSNVSAFLFFYSISIAGKVFIGNFSRVARILLVPKSQLASTSSIIIVINQSVLPVVGLLIFLGEYFDMKIYYIMRVGVLVTFLAGILVMVWMPKVAGLEARPAVC